MTSESIIITGGAGFIGSNFINYLVNNTIYHIICVDMLNYASDTNRLPMDRITFVKMDLSKNYKGLTELFEENKINTVINFAAESCVDRSFEDPLHFTANNILGTQNLLEVIRKLSYSVKFIHISTDEVYGEQDDNDVNENDNLNPSNPYAATKASIDLIIKSYQYSYNLPIIIVRANNIYGPNQYPEKIIPVTIQRLKNDESIPIHGNGSNKRKYLYIKDFIDALMIIWDNFGQNVGEIFNIGCDFEIDNLSLVNLIGSIMGKTPNIEFIKDRNYNDSRYSINYDKLKQLGWKPQINLEQGLNMLING
ncbi:sterol-4-alpha-carboxylate 3-dehydrogenase, decarboxylating [[Candida] jaroonii]|uniref:Sterol-4-alpha-carboxylate 3-dehydrogenase, decarboxylating n=1 Tax=[Candida] jaroonii TaxID=467808 RepID=A0ACA9YAF2_9ASCO|nr:sterol-4-alpha-carboxylate 3-dehydrogenase, decarboxylating [[Candida] jaroonii]